MTKILPLTYKTEDIPALFQWHATHWRSKQAAMEKMGFPKKIPGTDRYSKPQVDNWFRTNATGGKPKLQIVGPAIETAIDIQIDETTAALEKKYAS